MMKRTLTLLILTALTVSCGAAERKAPIQQVKSAEDWIQESLESWAKSSSQCSEPKLNLVKSNATKTRSLISDVKKVVAEAKSAELKPDLSHLGYLAKDVNPKHHLAFIVTIVTGDTFLGFLDQIAGHLNSLAEDADATTSIAEVHNLLFIKDKPANRIANVVNKVTSNSDALQKLLEASKVALCDEYRDEDVLSAFLLPKIFSGSIEDAQFYGDLLGLARVFAAPAYSLKDSLAKLTVSTELKDFFTAVKAASGTPADFNICTVKSLDAYKPYFELVAKITNKASDAEERPLLAFGSMLFKLYSMNDQNNCAGQSLTDMNKDNAGAMLKELAKFIGDDKSSLKAMLKFAQP